LPIIVTSRHLRGDPAVYPARGLMQEVYSRRQSSPKAFSSWRMKGRFQSLRVPFLLPETRVLSAWKVKALTFGQPTRAEMAVAYAILTA
jgi:hypothetical protein